LCLPGLASGTDETANRELWLHSYSREFSYIPYIYAVLAGLAIWLYLLASSFLDSVVLPVDIPRSPTFTLAFFGVLVFLFDRFLWKILCNLPWIKVVDYSGVYIGSINSSKNGESFETSLTINQTWSKILVTFESGDAVSDSFSASLVAMKQPRKTPRLWYNYYTEGTYDGVNRVSAHYGTTELRFYNRTKTVKGRYFTEESRDSAGAFDLVRKSRWWEFWDPN